jgi:mono/diheme cytochrome c family protein
MNTPWYTRRAILEIVKEARDVSYMNRQVILIVTLGVLIFASSCNKSATAPTRRQPSATPDPFAATRAVFAKNCQQCHGESGTGGPVKLEDGTRLKVPSLREGHALRHPDSDFVKQITKGGDGMPAFGDKLKPDQINDLVRFIRHEFQAGASPPTDASPMKDMKK